MQIRVKVLAGQKKLQIEKISENRYEISVQEKTLQNAANYKVREVLANIFSTDITNVRLVGGHHKPSKLFEIKNYPTQ